MNLKAPLQTIYGILNGRTGLVVLLIFGLAITGLLWNEGSKPRYQGKTKERWLSEFSAEPHGSIFNPDQELTPQHKQALEAFQYFGKDGFDNLARQRIDNPSMLETLKAQLARYQWFRL